MSELMTAVVLAEGEEEALRPLTCDVPKPMVRLCGRPLMAYTLDLLERHGVRRARICTRYLPTRVEEGLGEQHRGVALSYQESDRDCGPAGNARQALLAARQRRDLREMRESGGAARRPGRWSDPGPR